MQKGKTSKFVPKLGLVLWMFPLSSWAISGTIPEANSALTSYAHEAREIDAIAQSAKKRTVTGTITDASDGTPIIGANIVVKGSQTGVISDLDGNYSIEVSSKDVLVISFIGYYCCPIKSIAYKKSCSAIVYSMAESCFVILSPCQKIDS